jgi:uncharacterized protein
MSNPQIDYASLVEKALLRVVHDVLAMVAQEGLPGRHHLYITFRSDHPDVVMDDALRARYPNEMTIVLQHEFWALEVDDDRFAITLSFNSQPQRLVIPFEAVTVFADPSVEFGLQFTRTGASGPATPKPAATLPVAADTPAAATKAPEPIAEAPAAAEVPTKAEPTGADGEDQAQDRKEDKVVTLDRFRKK